MAKTLDHLIPDELISLDLTLIPERNFGGLYEASGEIGRMSHLHHVGQK
jgi:hypothetical protein